MPYSPFARFLALVIVALFALALLWPDDRAQLWGLYSLATLPLIVGVFTWNVVRSAAPYDDRAFHRCLPPGPGHAFLRVLWIHLLVLAGIALAVLVYCWQFNLSWRAMSYGIALLTLPLWAFITAIGLACTMAATNQHWRSPGWISIFAAPVFSWGVLYWARMGFAPETEREVYLTPLRTVVLAAGGLYPLIWWLASVPRRRPLGMLLGAATGALLPWLYVYGDFFKAPDRGERHEMQMARHAATASPLMVTRKPVPETSANWIPVSDLIDVEGLAEGESASISWSAEWAGETGREGVLTFEIRDEKDTNRNGIRYVEAQAYRSGGKLLWGEEAIWQSLRSQLPPHERFEYWDPSLNRPTSPPVILRPGASVPRSPRSGEERKPLEYRKLTPDLFKSSLWKGWVSEPMRWTLLGNCETKRSARFKLASGGIVKVDPLKEEEGGHHMIRLHYYLEDLWADGAPWFGQDGKEPNPWMDLRLCIVDESGKQVYAVDRFGLLGSVDEDELLLGRRNSFAFDAGAADTPEQIKRIEMLRRAKIYVFVTTPIGSSRFFELPPPPGI